MTKWLKHFHFWCPSNEDCVFGHFRRNFADYPFGLVRQEYTALSITSHLLAPGIISTILCFWPCFDFKTCFKHNVNVSRHRTVPTAFNIRLSLPNLSFICGSVVVIDFLLHQFSRCSLRFFLKGNRIIFFIRVSFFSMLLSSFFSKCLTALFFTITFNNHRPGVLLCARRRFQSKIIDGNS